jgi:hypothetical protein
VVLIASGSSPDRAIALERMLGAAADRSGWAERLEIRLGGIDGGAGRISDSGLAALHEIGIDATGAVCPDLERRPALLEGAAIIVCDRGDVADTLVDWSEAGEAEFVCVSELGDPAPEGPSEEEEPDDASIADEVHDYQDTIDEVLRRVVSTQAT